MVRRTVFRALVCVAILAAIGFSLSACGGGGSSGKGGKDLYLKRFLLVDENLQNLGGTGTTNAYRDTRLLFVFSAPVNLKSITSRTIRIGIPVGSDLWLEAPGRFRHVTETRPDGGPVKVIKNQVLFEPTYTKHNEGDVEDNPFGLDANSVYEVIISSRSEQDTFVESEDGDGIVQGFYAQFETSDTYQQNLRQPTLVETIPKDGEIDVAAAADVVLRFTEPMKPDSFKLGQSVFVRNLSIDRAVLGSLRFSKDAKTVTFRPVFGYGKGPSEIFVRVTTAVTNLPGNPIPKEIRVQFVSIFDATQFNQGDVQEAFTDNVYEDTGFQNQFPLADWNKGVTQGFLAGTFTSGTVTISGSSSTYLWPPWAWGGNFAAQFQTMYLSGEVGGSRTITGFEWFKYCRQSQTVTNVTINMGHTQSGNLTTTLAGNYSDTPVTCVNNVSSYSIPQVPLTGWLLSPTYTTNFLYNGTDNVILEIFCTCSANGNNNSIWTGLWRVNTPDPLTRCAYTAPSWAPPSPRTAPHFLHIRFGYLIDQSEAQSKWYDMGIRTPLFLNVFLEPDLASQPAGTTSSFTFQGAPEDLSDPGNPDMLNATQWVDNLEKLTGLKFVRFHVSFKSNPNTNTRPLFDTVIFPFVWK
ncbi:MAG: Ig-like domain-containing domain [Planctomycetota bacterium]|jgi:hypothetical protein